MPDLNSIYLSEFLTIAVVHLLAVASPGPDFAIIVRQSITYGKTTARWSSLGVGLGILIHVVYSLAGVGLIISQSIIAFNVMKYLGAAYLIYMGIKALKAQPENVTVDAVQQNRQVPSTFQAVRMGFITNGLNPKATLFFLSLFTVVIKPDTPLMIQSVYGLYLAIATGLWFTMISSIFGQPIVRNLFKSIGHWFERTMGAALIFLGIKLAVSSNQ